MKRNVDLTQNRIFSSDRRSIKDIGLFEFRITNPGQADYLTEIIKLHPWAVDRIQRIYRDEDLVDDKSTEVILTGDASARKHKKYLRSADRGDMCDCCGIDLTKKPWDRHYCLCNKCMDRLDKFVEHHWEYKDDLINNSTDRIVLEMNFRPQR